MPDVSRVPAPDPASVLSQIEHVRPLDRAHHPADECPRCVADALLAGRRQDKERIEELLQALVAAALPLEVLRGQSAMKPYRELTTTLQQEIVEATDVIRAALADKEDTE